jgi:NAD(P)H dehydrogenase (quinone)
MEGWIPFIQVAAATGFLPSLHHSVEAEFPTVAAPDVGRIAADFLRNVRAGTEEQIVDVEGPRRYSANDVAAALSQLLGRSVRARLCLARSGRRAWSRAERERREACS